MASKTTEKDLYVMLEITKEASETDVKKAYKKMALKWHPDKNPDNTAVAEEKFKEIAEAYAILSNPEKRKLYDKYGYAGVNPSSPAGFQGNFARGGTPSAGFGFQDFTFDAAERIFEEFFSKNPFDGMGTDFPSFFGRRNRGATTNAAPTGDGSPFSGGRSPFGASPFGSDGSPFSGGSPFGGGMFGNDDFFKNAFARHEKMMKNFGAGFGGGFGDFFGAAGAGGFGAFDGFNGTKGSTGGVSKSVSTTTKIENGRKVTVTKTTTKGPDGVTKTEVKESVDDGQGNRQERHYIPDANNQKPTQHKLADVQKPHHHQHVHAHGHTTHASGHTQNRPHGHTGSHGHSHTQGHSHGGHAHVRGPLKPHN